MLNYEHVALFGKKGKAIEKNYNCSVEKMTKVKPSGSKIRYPFLRWDL
jgi:hypothetical protein